MDHKELRIAGLLAFGLFLAALLIVLPTTAARSAASDLAGAEPGPVNGPTLHTTLPLTHQQPEPGPTHTTLVIHYQGQDASPELMLALANLETAGQISALDAASAPGRIFVLGERQALLALRDLTGVVAIIDARSTGEPLLSAAESPQLVEASPEQDFGELSRAVRESNQSPQLVEAAPEQIRESDAVLNTQYPIPIMVSDAPLASRGIYADGYITGVVTADDGGARLADVSVIVEQDSPYVYRHETTDANGVYTISVPPGTYRVSFYPSDYHVSEYYDDVPMTNSSGYTPVVVGDGETVSGINASVAPGMVVSGRVTDQETTDPLTGIRVFVDSYGNYYYGSAGVTNANGVYTATPGLPAGTYTVSFEDYSDVYANEYYSDTYRYNQATPIVLTGSDLTGIDASLAKAANIAGDVTGPGAVPISDVDIIVYDTDEYQYVDSTTTDENGHYFLRGLAPTTYKLRFRDDSDQYLDEWYQDQADWDAANPITLTSGMTTTIDVELAQAGAIAGVVTAEGGGAPLSDIDVNVYDASSGSYVQDDTTDASGFYRVGGLGPGNYKLYLRDINNAYLSEYYDDKPDMSSADPVSVTTGMTTTVNAQLAQAGFVAGTVTVEGSGAPLSNVSVNIYSAANTYLKYSLTDASGAYSIGGLVSGDYKLGFYDNNGVYMGEYYDDQPDLGSAAPFSVTQGMTTTINAQLAPGGVISGMVTAEDGGAPLDDISVSLTDASTGSYLRGVDTDASGAYRIGGLTAGSYKVRFYDYGGVYLGEYYDDKPDWDSANPVAVTAGMTSTANAQLALAGAISGVVTAEGSGAPLADIDVDAYEASSGDYVNDGETDASGVYWIRGLAPGDYKLRFRDTNEVYLTEYYDDKPNLNSGDTVSVSAGLTSTANAQLALGGVVNGVVTAEGSGAPLDNIDVNVYDASSGDYVADGDTDASGAYRIRRLPTGSYKMYLRDYGGVYLSEYYDDKSAWDSADTFTVTAGITTTINMALARGGNVTGRVTDAASGAGIASVSVQAQRYDAYASNISSNTDANGYYTITALYTGVYQVSFYPPRPYFGQRYDGFRLGSGVDLITVTAPLTTTGINAALSKGYYISGTVTSGSTPLGGVSVRAYSGDSTSSSASYNTGSDGLYWLGPLDPNYYRVQFQPSNTYASEWYDDAASYDGSTPLHLNGDIGNVNADLAAGGSITGRVTGSGGAPLADLWVYVYPAGHSNSVVYAETDADGYYATPDVLASGQYQVDFSAPLGYNDEWYDNKSAQDSSTLVSVVAGQTTGNVNAQLDAYAHGAITGTVTAADTGLPLSMWVYAYSYSGLGTWSAYADGGSFEIEGLPPDAYRVKYNAPPYPYITGFYHDQADWDSADLVTVTAGLTTSLQVQALQVGGSISGTVTGPDGGLPGVHVYVQRVVGSYLTNSTYTGVDGGYYVPGLDAGEYRVQFTPPSPFIREYYDDALDWGASSNVTVTLGATTPHVDAVMEVGGVITGYITAADTGAPLPGAYANVYSATGSLVRDYAYARADGLYQTPGLPAGTYQVLFQVGPWSRYIAEWYDDAQPASVHMTVTVPVAGVTPNINAALDQGGSISGWTYNALQGLPMRSVRARVYDAVSGSYIRYDDSNNGGLYQVNGLPSGQYKVFFEEDGFESQWYSQTLDQASALTVTVNAPEDTPNINAYLDMYVVYLPLVLRQSP